MSGIRGYPQVFDVDPTDAYPLDRIGVGTRFIEGSDLFPAAIGYPTTITATDYTIQSTDNGQTLDFVNPAASQALVPAGLLPQGFECFISQGGTGQVTVIPLSGASLVNEDGLFSTDKQYGELKLKQFSASSYRLYGRTSGGIAVPAQQITNYFGPLLGDAAINFGYSASAGAGQGVPAAINGFATSGLIPVTPGTTYTIDLYAADAAWIFNTSSSSDGAYFYSATPATHANLTALLTYASGVTFTADGKSVTFTVPTTSPATAYVAISYKWALGGSFVSGRPVPSGVLAPLLSATMLNKSSAAVVQSAFGTPGTVDQVTTPLVLAAGQMGTVFNGQWVGDEFVSGFRYDRIPWSGGKHLVQRMQYFAENYYNNNILEFASICLIDAATPGPSTPGAFGAQLSLTTPSANCLYLQSDNSPALGQDSGKFTGGAHGILCWLVPATAHGLVNANRGAIFTDGVTNWTIARIGQNAGGDPNNLLLMPPIAGPETDWLYSLPNISGTTLTYVSGGAPTSPITITGSPAALDLYPANASTTINFAFNGGTVPVSNGVYVDTGLWSYLSYNIPNVFDTQSAVFALNGVAIDAPSQYNTGTPQVNIGIQYFSDPYGAVTVTYNATALQSYNRNSMWPSQNQGGIDMANYGAGETFHEFMEGMQPFAPNFPQSGGTTDFSTFPNMTSNSSQFWGLAANRQPPSYYADNQPHNATFAIHGVQNSGASWIRSKWCMANDDVDGRSASADPAVVPQSYLFSAADKMYMATANVQSSAGVAFNTQVPQGTIDTSVGGFGMEHPDLADPTNSYGSFVYSKGGGVLAWRWYTPNTLTNYAIPIRPDMIGKSIQIIKQAATVTLLDTAVNNSGVHVTTTGPGGFSVILS